MVTKILATVAVLVFVLVVVVGGIAAAFVWPWWAVAAYAVGSLWAGFIAGEALGEVWLCDMKDLI